MAIICRSCGRDIDAIGQDNMSNGGRPVCEDCADEDNESVRFAERADRDAEEVKKT